MLHHRGRRKIIFQIRIGKFSRRDDFPRQGFRNRVDSAFAHVADPKARIDVYRLFIEKIELNCGRRIEKDYNLFYRPRLLHLGESFQDVDLIPAQRKTASIEAVGEIGRSRKVGALAAVARDVHDRRGVFAERRSHGSVFVVGNFVYDIQRALLITAVAVADFFLIKLPQIRIYR